MKIGHFTHVVSSPLQLSPGLAAVIIIIIIISEMRKQIQSKGPAQKHTDTKESKLNPMYSVWRDFLQMIRQILRDLMSV